MAWPTPGCAKLIDAMIVAEGGEAAFIRAVRCSQPLCDSMPQARVIAANTIAHALWDWRFDNPTHDDGSLLAFVSFLGARWAPIGAANDPKGLNVNWVPNVVSALRARGEAIT